MGRQRIRAEGDLCVDCGENTVRFKGYTPGGNERYDKRCGPCHNAVHGKPWLRHRGDSCEMCGHVPLIGKWSLDVHHLDFDKDNNEPENLMTLCKNCHSTYHALDHEYGDSEIAFSVLRKFIKALMK